MATVLVSQTADFSARRLAFLAPVTSGLLYWGYPGNDAVATARNLAGGADGTIAGAPAYHTGYASFSEVNYVATAVNETSSWTVVVAARSADNFDTNDTRPWLYGYWQSTGFGLFVSAKNVAAPGAKLTVEAAYTDGSTVFRGATDRNIPDFSVWGCYMGRVEAGVGRTVKSLTTGVSTVGADTRARSLTATPANVGSGGPSSFNGNSDIAFVAAYSRALTDAEIDKVYQRAKAYLAERSITI